MKKKTMINIESLYVKYSNTDSNTLKNIHFRLYENEIVSIIGESGSGKTTLAKYIMGFNDNIAKSTIKEYCLFEIGKDF